MRDLGYTATAGASLVLAYTMSPWWLVLAVLCAVAVVADQVVTAWLHRRRADADLARWAPPEPTRERDT